MAKDDEGDKKGEEEKGGGGKKKLILIVVPVLLVVSLAAVYFLVLKPSSSTDAAAGATTAKKTAAAAPEASSTYVEGKVVKTDAISINLAGGHYLKLSLALQATADAGEEVSTAKAVDAAITLFSQKSMEELATREGREKAKEKLTDRLKVLYEDKVYEVYFTEFVMQ